MSKKHFELLAATMRTVHADHVAMVQGREPTTLDRDRETMFRLTVAKLARALEGTNDRFDSGRFVAACYSTERS